MQFNQVNIVCRDIDASRAFYELLGLEVGPPMGLPGEGRGRHAEAAMASGTTVEFDDEASARTWAPAWAAAGGVVLGFAVETSGAVDEAFARLTAAGHAAIEAPYDAFWGARYAIVADPDGNAVGIMGPRSSARPAPAPPRPRRRTGRRARPPARGR